VLYGQQRKPKGHVKAKLHACHGPRSMFIGFYDTCFQNLLKFGYIFGVGHFLGKNTNKKKMS
jgi:hypothetical protein